VFNVTGGELVIILLVALIVLGPDELPDAIRKVGRVYGELRRMSQGFQSEIRDALDEPMREVRDTMNTMKGGFRVATTARHADPQQRRPERRTATPPAPDGAGPPPAPPPEPDTAPDPSRRRPRTPAHAARRGQEPAASRRDRARAAGRPATGSGCCSTPVPAENEQREAQAPPRPKLSAPTIA
jgi:sec-independent protein translocase protein TatB